jgi:hypothetical protein
MKEELYHAHCNLGDLKPNQTEKINLEKYKIIKKKREKIRKQTKS